MDHRSDIELASWLHNPEGWIDRRHVLGRDVLISGTHDQTVVTEAGLRLGEDAQMKYPGTGVWQSPVVVPAEAFTELLPSWNVFAPPGTGLRLEVQTRDAARGDWSPWLHLGTWGSVSGGFQAVTEFNRGRVEIDVLRLRRPADAFKVRLDFLSFAADADASAIVRRVMVVTSAKADEQAMADAVVPTSVLAKRDLPVPFHTQQNNPEAIRSRTCSPTSVSMVMAYRGVDLPTADHAVGIYDTEYGIFGNWGRAVAWASQHGLTAELARIRNWEQVEAHVSAGQPLIASIAFDEGEFPSNVMEQTDGHLIVVRGLTAEGDAIVNDPASADRGDGIIYKKEELAAAWFSRGGVTYLIGEADPGGP
ncbi:MAG: C39 family peptidase [Planctomycetota bacterium]